MRLFSGKSAFSPPTIVGVGIVFAENEKGEKIVHKVAPNGPSDMAKVLVGDVLVAINNFDVSGLNVNQTAAMCKGDQGSVVEMKLKRMNGLVEAVSVKRDFISTSISNDSSRSTASLNTAAPGSLGLALETRNGEKTVASVHPDGPAALAGLVVGDVIITVDGVLLSDLTNYDAAKCLRGVSGSDAVLVVRKNNGEEVFTRIRRGPPLAAGAPLFFPGLVSVVGVDADGARSVDNGCLSLNGKTITVGKWSCDLEGDAALRVGPLEFFISINNHSFAILFPEPYPVHKRIIEEFEKRIAGLTRYRSTLPGSWYNTPCPEHEVKAFVGRIRSLDPADRKSYFEAIRNADPHFAYQVASFWRSNGFEGELCDRDAVERAGRRISEVVGSFMKTDADGTNPQAKKIVHFGGVVGETLRAGAMYTEGWVVKKAEEYASELPEPAQKQVYITTGERKAIQTAKKVTDGIVHGVGIISSGAETLGRTVGTVVSQSVSAPKDVRVVAAGQLAGATIGALAGTIHALRDASIVVLGGVKKAAVTVATKKYGDEVGGALEDGLSVACNVGSTTLVPTAFAEGLAKGAAKSMILEASQRVSRQSELIGGVVLKKGKIEFQELVGIWSVGKIALWPRAIAIYPPDVNVPGLEDDDEPGLGELQEGKNEDDKEEEEDVRFVEVEEQAGSSNNNNNNNSNRDSWVLIEGFVPIDRNANDKVGNTRKIGMDRIIALNTITKICLSDDPSGRCFEVRVRGRARSFQFQAASNEDAQAWTKSLLQAAGIERRRLLASWQNFQQKRHSAPAVASQA